MKNLFIGVLLSFVCLGAIGQTTPKVQKVKFGSKSYNHIPRSDFQFKMDCAPGVYRTIDGTCNNAENPLWGASDIQLVRKFQAQYGSADSLNAMGGENRISPRAISNLVFDQNGVFANSSNLSAMVFSWGQFLDHDVDLTPEAHDEVEMIPLPDDETLFTIPIPFVRSHIADSTGVTTSREQANFITSWVDGSNVYGSEQSRADWLRTFVDGKLKTSMGNFLPYNTVDGELNSDIDPSAPSMAGDDDLTTKMFVAGDVRANEQPGLTSLHTTFVREHNRLCDELIAGGMTDDEEIYQTARKQVGALIQAITYNEFLPALGINLPAYSGYNDQVDPSVMNIFATSAYRIGHTMVTREIPLKEDDCSDWGAGAMSLFDGFFNPIVTSTTGIDVILKGLATQPQEEIDARVVDQLRNLLFGNGDPTAPAFGLDLVSLNIQRGRDHGLADYNTVREHYLGSKATSFSDLTSNLELQNALALAYDDIDDMDSWVGFLVEDHLSGSAMGPTAAALLGEQFQAMRDGDWFFYQNDPALTATDISEIEGTLLSDIIVRNTNLSSLQTNIFYAEDCESNQAVVDGVNLSMRVFLQGAMATAGGGMTDALFDNSLIPFELDTMMHYFGDDSYIRNEFESDANLADLLNALPDAFDFDFNNPIFSGTNTMTDWVKLELRPASAPEQVVYHQFFPLQCDGNVVDSLGNEILVLNVPAGDYYVVVNHRNHLGAMTKEPMSLSSITTPIDFTGPTATWGEHAQVDLGGGRFALWAGDSDGDGQILYQGFPNDINGIFFDITSAPDNALNLTNFILPRYSNSDINMDGQGIFQGDLNDSNNIFFNTLLHPANSLNLTNFAIFEQIP